MTFESEPPIDMRMQFQRRKLLTGEPDAYIVVKLHYPRPNSIRIMTGGNVIKPISLLDNNGENPVDTTVCGSNKYFYFNNTIEFVITGAMGCMVRVSLTTSLQLTARFSMDINDFFTADGETKFVDRLCALLGIADRSRVKVVGVYTGSVVLVATIEEPITTSEEDAATNNNTAHSTEMADLQAILTNMVDDGSLASDMDTNGLPGLVGLESSLYTNDDQDSSSSTAALDKNMALIAGVVIGSAAVVAMIIAGAIYFYRKRAKIHHLPPSSEDTFQQEKKFEDNVSEVNSVVNFERSARK